ncbi:MAG: serine hydrolase domain-containing protein [Armatimonadota bacterium]
MQRLQEMLEEGRSQGLYPGASFRVFRADGEILGEGVTGLADPEAQAAVTPGTIWDLASLTKPVATATSVLILAQEGRLHLNEEVARYLPADLPPVPGITLRHCLTHTSGLKPWEQYHSQALSPDEILRRIAASGRQAEPGEAYAYSDLGYILLGEVVRTLAGYSVAQLARERIFAPLEMTDTAFTPPAEWRPRLAATRCADRGWSLVGEVHDGNCDALGGVAGHAGLFGTLDDLQRYSEMLLNEGAAGATRVLAPLAAREMARNQNPPGLNGHTLGWFTRPNGFLPAGDFLPPDTFGHTGFTGTSLLLSPSLRLGILLLTNRVYQDRDAADFLRFRRRFHNAAAGLLGL